MKLLVLILKNLFRNKIRSMLTTLAIVLLVVIFSMITTVMRFIDEAVADKDANIYMIMTERYRFPSVFDRSFMDEITKAGDLNAKLMEIPGFDPEKYTVWHFIGFTLDTEEPPKNKDLQFFCLATLPEKIPTMIEGLEGYDLTPCAWMRNPPKTGLANIGMLMGPERMEKLGLQVGDVFDAKSISHRVGYGSGLPTGKPIEMRFEIVAPLPAERWGTMALIDYEYLDRVLKENRSEMDGKVMLGWLQVPDKQVAEQVGLTIEDYNRDLKVETAATARGRFMEPVQGLLFGIKWILAPAILVVMTVIIANAISITVRERQREIAVLKVLGFSGARITCLVMGEAMILGVTAGMAGAFATYGLVNLVMGGLTFSDFFPTTFVPLHVFWWGAAIGSGASGFAAALPAWTARSVKVSEVFAKVT